MPRILFINPPLVLDEDFIDYPYFANHGLLACAGLAARAGAQVEIYDAFALPASGRHAPTAAVLGVEHDISSPPCPTKPSTSGPRRPVFVRTKRHTSRRNS
jgi:hypothetical protein